MSDNSSVDRRHAQKRARGEPPGVVDIVVGGDSAPLAWILVVLPGNGGERLTLLEYVDHRAVRRHQVQLPELLRQVLVLAQGERQRGAKWNPVRAEQRELLADALDNTF